MTKIAVIEKSKFVISDYDEILQNSYTEILHRNTPYMYILTFEQYTVDAPFDHVFNSREEYEAWLIYVPPVISKLQAVSELLKLDKYADLISVLEADETGVSKILFDAAHQLYRDSEMVNTIGMGLGFSDEDTDTFFVNSSKILV